MSLADEVLAEHIKDGADCLICMFPWPCAAVRLATQLRAAEQVVEAAEKVTDYFRDDYEEVLRPLNESIVTYRLAERDKGGRE